MKFLEETQSFLESTYQASSQLCVSEFVRPLPKFTNLGTLLVEHVPSEGGEARDLNLALLLDRDLLGAWDPKREPLEWSFRSAQVVFEEVSHFVYLGFNHLRDRNVTSLEMEIQSEVDRVLLASHGPFSMSPAWSERFIEELKFRKYPSSRHEEARWIALEFLRGVGLKNIRNWGLVEFQKLLKFFHSDLAEKIHLSKRR